MNQRNGFRQFDRARRRRHFEHLETRRVLDGDSLVLDFAAGVYAPDSEEQAIVDKLGTDLAWLHSNWTDYQSAGGEAVGSFAGFSNAVTQIGFAVQDDFVAIEAYAGGSAAAIRDALTNIGFQELAAFGRGLSGWLPLASLDELASVASLNFARLAYGGVTNAGSTTTQGDAAQRSDDVRATYAGVNGGGVTVGVISDSYDISTSAGGSAALDVASADLPSGVNVLDDSGVPNQSIDEGRAMLQIVHDVAPGAGLAFHAAGISQVSMADAIVDLQGAGADVIVDDVTFFAEPMFQDGVIAQAVDEVTSDGVVYVSAAGNQARRSYESTFNVGQTVTINGVPEIAHEFSSSTHDIFQRVTIPTGGRFLASFQWDSSFASAGGVGSSNDLNVYLINGSTIVAQGRTNNIGGDAVEVIRFNNATINTQFDVLITKASGASPGVMKYVDFGTSVTFNEYLNNSTTLFGHANADGAIAVGAASFLSTPEFGVNPPAIESFSALAGTPILFDTNGVRRATPLVREKTNVVGPDGVNTTFFGTDIAGDADAFPNFFGTSAAAPHVAGLAALMLDHVATLQPKEVKAVLERSAVDMDNPFLGGFQTGFDFATGYGLVHGLDAIETAQIPVVGSVAISGPNSGDAGGGSYEIPTGSGEQLRTVPIGGANKITIRFSTPINTSTVANKLTLRNKQTNALVTVSGTPTASVGNTTFTWTLSTPLPPGSYRITLADTILSTFGEALDGEFTNNPVSISQLNTSVLPSGNGTPGGAFNFDFTYLSADSNRDNKVDGADLIVWKNNFGGAGDIFTTGDGSGDGYVDGTDFLKWQSQLGKNFTNLALANAEITSFATVAGVTIGGSGTTHASYAVPTGSGEQLRTIPIGGADTISLTFTADVSLVGDELLVYGADSGTHYGVVFEGYDALTYTATWRVASGVLPPEQLVIKLTDGVVDGSSTPLDGDWLNPATLTSSDDYLRDLSVTGAGDGLASGAFEFRVSILPGDFNLDNKVDSTDKEIQSDNLGMILSGAEFTDGDFDGDGDVDVDDETALLAVMNAGVVDFTVFADIVAPRVTSVWFDGSNSVHAPYLVPTGSGEQLRTVPMGGVDTIKLTFDEWVDLDGTELTAYGVTTGTTYSLTFVGYSFGIATWQLASSAVFPAEQLLLRLDDSIVDAAGNALDGEFTNPWTLVDPAGSSTTLPSGDGVAGGDFRFRATILPSDFDRDNDVDSADGAIRTANSGSTTALHQHGDTDGDGDVDGSDFLKWQTQLGYNLTNWKSIEPGMILVSSAADEGDDSDYSIGDVTLREALARAYAQAGDDAIVFRDTLSGQTINLSLGQLTINSNVTIDGLGADVLTVLANGTSRVFSVNSGVTAAINGLTISGGGGVTSGGGIHSEGDLTLDSIVVSGNHTILNGAGTNHGGGVYSLAGSLFVINSTIDDNQARYGGGLSVSLAGASVLEIRGSTISNNRGLNTPASGQPDGLGGGLLLGSVAGATGQAMIVNSTFSGNLSKQGAALSIRENTTVATIVNSTITDNHTKYLDNGVLTAITGGYAGGIQIFAASGAPSVTLHNTIVAGNTGSNTNYHDIWGAAVSGSKNNLIGQIGGSGLTNGVNGNMVGTQSVLINPLLGALAYNGGPTKTHALLQGSLAIDAGDNDEADDLLLDQRRRARLVDGDDDGDLRVDIGAYEVEYDEFFASLGA